MNTRMKKYTLLRWFWFLAWLVELIFQWNAVKWIHWEWLSHLEVITTHTDTQIQHSVFIIDPGKTFFVTMEEDDNQFKITCQPCNGFVTCKCRSGKLLYINFIGAILFNMGPYSEELNPENFYFQWLARTKMQRMYHILWK